MNKTSIAKIKLKNLYSPVNIILLTIIFYGFLFALDYFFHTESKISAAKIMAILYAPYMVFVIKDRCSSKGEYLSLVEITSLGVLLIYRKIMVTKKVFIPFEDIESFNVSMDISKDFKKRTFYELTVRIKKTNKECITFKENTLFNYSNFLKFASVSGLLPNFSYKISSSNIFRTGFNMQKEIDYIQKDVEYVLSHGKEMSKLERFSSLFNKMDMEDKLKWIMLFVGILMFVGLILMRFFI